MVKLKNIVNSLWLNHHLNDENLVILDATQQAKRAKINIKFQNLQIIGSRYFDIKNDFSDTASLFPNTFPSQEKFEKSCRNLGINNDSLIVVYDAVGVFSSARVWWMFKTFGYQNIAVLDGGFPDWIDNGFNTEIININNRYKKGNFKANLISKRVWSFNNIQKNIEAKEYLVVDARSKERFNSLVKESRSGLRSGNIPNSVNLPYTELLENGKFKPVNELEKIFSKFDQTKPFVFSCGSGITACILLLANELVTTKFIAGGKDQQWQNGKDQQQQKYSLLVENTNNDKKQKNTNKDLVIYDGSWTEFGSLTSG